MSEHNPFTPPESDLRPSRKGQQFIQEFPRLPTMLFVGLGLLTLGLYIYAWIYTRNAMMNRCVPEGKRIPSWLSNSTVALGVITFCMSALGMLLPESSIGKGMIEAQSIFAMVSFFVTMIWFFTFRGLLNALAGAQPGQKLWINGIILVLFTAYYLQYKINQIHEQNDMQPPPKDDDYDSFDDTDLDNERKPKQGYIEL